MIKFRGHTYRGASYSEWEAIYNEAIQSGKVPSWDEMFQTLYDAGMLESWLSEHYEYMGWDYYAEDDEEAEAKAVKAAKDHFAQAYFENVLTAVGLSSDEECWRRFAYDTLVHPKELPIGIYWSRASEGADTYWADDDLAYTYLFRARVNPDAVDIPETVRMNMINEEEYEIRYHPGKKLWVYDCHVYTYSHPSWDTVDSASFVPDDADDDEYYRMDEWVEELQEAEDHVDIKKMLGTDTFPINEWRTTEENR